MLAAFVVVMIQPAAAIVCPVSQFAVTFEPNSAELTSEGAEALAVGHNRALSCENAVLTLLTNGRDPVGRDRAARARSYLFALGLPSATQVYVGIDEVSALDDAPPPNDITLFVSFD